ncbi:S-layer homology domain-containing protein [Paenibacillus guangzhouensis]|uniref:S-layer homology domain-containing protein n=1 Tax=Paenibacillus guangzhouensis TaxID=1473112 RepID=UPI00187B7EB5|nr:S-layer homology domain-containing protein [Paenibacillus guangzhouensis]
MSNKSYNLSKSYKVKDIQGGETKVMKKFLTIALSTAMAFSMFASVAFGAEKELTTQDKYDALTKAGIFEGFKDGTAGLDQNMTRAQFAKVVAKLLSLEDDAATATSKYVDVKANNWAAPFIGSVSKAGLMEGSKNQKGQVAFDFNGNVTVEQMAKVLVIALKLEVPATAENGASAWAKGYVDAAVKAGLIPANANFKAAATREQLVIAAYTASVEIEKAKVSYEVKVVDANNIQVTFSDAKDKPESFKLEKALEANKENTVTVKRANGQEKTLKFTWTITAATKVESVKADNLKEILVTFDGEVDAKTAGAKENYDIKNKDESIKSVTVADDKKSALILLDEGDASTLTNQKEATLKVSNVYNSDKSKTLSAEVKFTPVDVKTPEVKEVVGLGTKAFKVVFSEPVKKAGIYATNNFKVDGKTIVATVEYKYPNIAIVTTDLAVGDHKLTVSNVEDFSGLKVIPLEKEFKVAVDTEAPQIVSAKTNDLKEVTLEFNETVKSVSKAYHNVTANGGTITEISDNKVTVTFANPMNFNENTIFVEGVTDYSGNSANREVKVTPTLDTERPTVAKAELKQDDTSKYHKLVIELSKSVDKDSAETAKNYTLKKSDGKAASAVGLNADGHPVLKPVYDASKKTVTIDLASKLDEATYTLEVNSIKDTAYVPNTMLPFTTTVSASVVKENGISRVWVNESSSNNEAYVYVQYKKPVNSDSARDTAKYTIAGQKLASGAYIDLVTADTVRITTPKTVDGKAVALKGTLTATLIQDANGDYIVGKDNYILSKEIGESTIALDTDSVKATSQEKLELKFDGKITSVDRTDFIVTVGATEATYKTYKPTAASISSDGSTISLEFKDSAKLPADMSTATISTISTNTQDGFGSKIAVISKAKVTDNIAPEIDGGLTVKSVTGATYYEISFTATEGLVNHNTANLNTLFTVKIGDKEATVGKDQVVVDGNKVTIYATPAKDVDQKVFSVVFDGAANARVKAITDNSGENALKGFNEAVVK